MNINNISPIWLKKWRFLSDSTGKRNSVNEGKIQPSIDGPKNIPAIISPITTGCPILLNR
jgi:hypothetical protein